MLYQLSYWGLLQISVSKLLTNFNGSLSTGGSYTNMINAPNEGSSQLLKVPPGAIRVVIDNEQVVGKLNKVGLNNSVLISVVTSKIYIFDEDGAL